MHTLLRKFLAALGGIAISLGLLYITIFSAGPLIDLLDIRSGLASEIGQGAVYKKFGDIYTQLSVLGLAICGGMTFTVFFWEKDPPTWRIQILYWLLLVCLVPLSFLNFWSSDTFVDRSQQALLDIVQAFLGSLCLMSLFKVRATTITVIVLRAFSVFFLAAQGVFIPALFASIWLLNQEGLLSLASTRDIGPGWVTIIATFASLSVTVMQYRLASHKQATETAHKSKWKRAKTPSNN